MATLVPVSGDPFARSGGGGGAPSFDSALAAEGVTGKLADVARSIYQQESGAGANTKTSNAGAVGGMQIIPATFNRVADKGWDIANPEQNMRAGIRYIKSLANLAGGDPALIAAGYYGGEGAIPKARDGVAISDPRNPKAPNTLQYASQVGSRIPAGGPAAAIQGGTQNEPQLVPVQGDPFKKSAPAAANGESQSTIGGLATDVVQAHKNVLGGLVRGAGSIGATAMRILPNAIGGDNAEENKARRESIDQFMKDRGVETDSLGYGAGKIGAEIAGTAGAGGVLANGLRAIPGVANAIPSVIKAIETAGMTTGARVAPGFIPGALDMGARVFGGAAVGAGAAGAADPSQAGMGALIGGAAPVVIKGIGALGSRAGNAIQAAVEPFSDKGQQRILGRLYNRVAGTEADALAAQNALANAAEIVPGSLPTAGQASGNAGIQALQRTASAIEPSATQAFTQRALDQNAAHINALRSVAGTDAELAAAELARRKATAPLYQKVTESTAEANPSRVSGLISRIIEANPKREALVKPLEQIKSTLYEPNPLTKRGQEAWAGVNDLLSGGPKIGKQDTVALTQLRTVMDRVKKGSIDAEEALAQLKDLKGINQVAQGAIDDAKRFMKMPDFTLSKSPQALKSAAQNIGDMIAAKGPNGKPVNEAIVRELVVIKKSLDAAISRSEPAYGQAQRTFADLSIPVNQMQVGRTILDKATSALPDAVGNPKVYAEQLARALRGDEATVKAATGFARNKGIDSVLSPQQMQTIQAVKDDVARITAANNGGKGVGSDTVQKLAYSNFVDASGIPTWLKNMGPAQAAGNIASRGADALYGRANRELAAKLAESGLNPKAVAEMMKIANESGFTNMFSRLPIGSASQRNAIQALISNQGISKGVSRALPVLAADRANP